MTTQSFPFLETTVVILLKPSFALTLLSIPSANLVTFTRADHQALLPSRGSELLSSLTWTIETATCLVSLILPLLPINLSYSKTRHLLQGKSQSPYNSSKVLQDLVPPPDLWPYLPAFPHPHHLITQPLCCFSNVSRTLWPQQFMFSVPWNTLPPSTHMAYYLPSSGLV